MSTRKGMIGALFLLNMSVYGAQPPPPRPQSATEVLRSLDAGSGDMEQLRLALQSPNPSVRAQTFKAMAESNNAALITMAIDEGHVSSDAVLRDMAARAAFREVRGLVLEPDSDTPAGPPNAVAAFSGETGLRVKLLGYDWVSGTFNAYNGEGQISASRLTFRTLFCQGSLAAKEGSWTYEGMVQCAGSSGRLAGRMHVSIR